MRAIRKVLASALSESSAEAFKLTGKSINDLPEYFLSVKVAEKVHDHFKIFTFSMETTVGELIDEVDLEVEDSSYNSRLLGKGKVDMVIRSKKSKKVRHLVEFKRHIGLKGLIADALRLSAVCIFSPPGHRTETNYLVAVTHRSEHLLDKRRDELQAVVDEQMEELGYEAGIVKVTFEKAMFVDEDNKPLTSTKRSRTGSELQGGVWEFKYVGK